MIVADASGEQRGAIVVGWLIRIVLSLALVGVAAFEAGAVIVAHVGADSAATDASTEAAIAYSNLHNARAAEQAARASAESNGARLIYFSVAADGMSVEVVVEKTARTLLLHRISFTRSWATARTTRRRAVPK